MKLQVYENSNAKLNRFWPQCGDTTYRDIYRPYSSPIILQFFCYGYKLQLCRTKLNFTFIEVNFHTWENLSKKSRFLRRKIFTFSHHHRLPAKLVLIDSPTFIRQTKKLDIFLKQSAVLQLSNIVTNQHAIITFFFSFSHSCFYIFNYLHRRHKETTSVRTEILCEMSFFTWFYDWSCV